MGPDGQVRLAAIDDPQRRFVANGVYISVSDCEIDPAGTLFVVFGIRILTGDVFGKNAQTKFPRSSSDLPKERVCELPQVGGVQRDWLAEWDQHRVEPVEITAQLINVLHIE